MNLLLMANNGLPRNGLVALYDPYRDTYGRNILPAGSENFVTGWTKPGNATITVTPNQADPLGGNNAYRIQSNGDGTNTAQYMINQSVPLPANTTVVRRIYAKVVSGNAKITKSGTAEPVLLTTTWAEVKITATDSDTYMIIRTEAMTDHLDILVYHPQVNLSTLYPYSPPAGLPQSLTDYTGHANNAQLGSAAGADTNNPAYSGQGLTFGADDYCKSSSPAFDDMSAFTCITVCKPLSGGGGGYGKIAWKAGASFGGWGVYLIDDGTYHNNVALIRYKDSANLMHWRTPHLGYNVPQVFCVSSIRSIADNSTKIFVNDQKRITDLYVLGSPAIVTDASNDLLIGNSDSATRNFDGTIYLQAWYNRILSDTEYMQAYSYLKRLMSSRGVTI